MLSYTEGRLAKGAMDVLYMAEQNKLEDLREQTLQDGDIDSITSVRVQMTVKELYDAVIATKSTSQEAIYYYFQFTPLLLNQHENKLREQQFLSTLTFLSKRGLIRGYAGSYWLTSLGKQMAELVEAIQ